MDVQTGRVDLSKEIVPDINSVGIDPGDDVNVGVSGPTGTTLWLLPNDVPAGQTALSFTVSRRR
jgi:hypothetical protein